MQARRRNLQLLLTLAALPVLLAIPVSLAAHGAPANEFRGRYVIQHSDDFAGGNAHFQPMLELADGDLLELNYGQRRAPDVPPGATVRVSGARQGNTVHVADGSTDVTSGPTTTLAAGSTKRVAVVLLNFSNNPTQPFTPAFAAGVAFNNANSVAAFYNSSSAGKLTLTGDVLGWYTIPEREHHLQPDHLGELRREGSRGPPRRSQSERLRPRRLRIPRGRRLHLGRLGRDPRSELLAERRRGDEPEADGPRARPQLRHPSRPRR